MLILIKYVVTAVFLPDKTFCNPLTLYHTHILTHALCYIPVKYCRLQWYTYTVILFYAKFVTMMTSNQYLKLFRKLFHAWYKNVEKFKNNCLMIIDNSIRYNKVYLLFSEPVFQANPPKYFFSSLKQFWFSSYIHYTVLGLPVSYSTVHRFLLQTLSLLNSNFWLLYSKI